jgi:hypothetical protein
MNKIFYYLLALVLFSCGSEPEEQEVNNTLKKETNNSAFENTGSTLADKSKDAAERYNIEDTISIKLTPYVAENPEIGATGVKLLRDRLNSGITKVGFGGDGSNPRFIIGPSITLLSKNITSTAPTKYANTYEINFMVVDVVTETIFTSYQTEFKGVGDSPEKAFLSGIRNIKFDNKEFVEFLVSAEEKIFSFFESNCSSILAEANSEAQMRNYDEAFSILKSIPSEAKECFMNVQDKKLEFFQLSLNKNCNEILAKMKAEFGKFNDPSASGFNAEAMSYYSMIDRQSECYDEAQEIYNKYLKNLDPKAKRDWGMEMKKWDFEMKKYDDQIVMAKEDQSFRRDSSMYAMDKEVKVARIQADAEIQGNKKLLKKYEYDESPWLVKVFGKFLDKAK